MKIRYAAYSKAQNSIVKTLTLKYDAIHTNAELAVRQISLKVFFVSQGVFPRKIRISGTIKPGIKLAALMGRRQEISGLLLSEKREINKMTGRIYDKHSVIRNLFRPHTAAVNRH